MKLLLSYSIFLFLSSTVLAQQIPIKGTPSWVKTVPFSKEVADTTNTSGGYYDLISDEQWNIPTKEAFHHFAQKILTEKGLENNSTITQSYDPTCETLTFHSILIHRDGLTIDKLKGGKFDVLRREENMERLIYDGDLTAVFNLHDIRVGDVLEYSYTVKGWNPAFGNKFSSSIYLNYGVPVGLVYVRLISDEKNALNISYVNRVPSPSTSTAEGKKYYEWKMEKIPAVTYEDGTPNWFESYNRIDVSDFKTWEEISLWSYVLFSPAFVSNKALDAKIDEFKREPDKDKAINQCIKFVQDEIRYLSFSDGIHGYKPHAAFKIFDQRYGDCKDKSVLLSYMLNRLGAESHPALVHSSKGRALSKLAASPIRFNHCIVTFRFQDSTYWVDPTMSLQRGALKHRYLPNYEYGLIIKKEGKGLTQIPEYNGESRIILEEIFNVAPVGTSALLKVTTTYLGDEADAMRDQFRESNLANVTKNYLNFYASDYPEIKSTRQITTKDDENENVFTTEEEYSIDPFWKYDTLQHKYSVQIYPRSLISYLKKPDTKIRSRPYVLTFPRNISHQVKLNMPEKWNVTEDSKTIETPGFLFKRSYSLNEKRTTIGLNYSYKVKKPFLEANEIKEHTKKIDEVYAELPFDISYTKNTTNANGEFNKPYVIIGLVTLVLSVLGLRKLNEDYDPDAKPATEYHDKIGGWLLLIGFGLFINPIGLAVQITDASFYDLSRWNLLMDPINRGIGLFELYQLVVDISFMCYAVFLCSIFVARRTSFPKLMVIFLSANLANHLVGVSFSSALDQSDLVMANTKLLLQAAFGAAIWIPYFLKSERVKGTFVNRH